MSSGQGRHTIGEVLVRAGIITHQELAAGVTKQRLEMPDTRLGQVLGWMYPDRVTDSVIEHALRHQKSNRTRRVTDIVDESRALTRQMEEIAVSILRKAGT